DRQRASFDGRLLHSRSRRGRADIGSSGVGEKNRGEFVTENSHRFLHFVLVGYVAPNYSMSMKQNTLWKIFGIAFLVALNGALIGANGGANSNDNPEKYTTSCQPIQIYLSKNNVGFGYVQLYKENAIDESTTFDNVSVLSQPDLPFAKTY